MSETENFGEKQPAIRRGRVDSLTIYEITDYELGLLAAGSPVPLYLNFSIFLLTVGISALLALLTTTFPSPTARVVAIVLTVVGSVGGVFLVLLWRRSRTSVGDILKRIRDRVPPEGGATSAGSGSRPRA
jgi:hypothetical protein